MGDPLDDGAYTNWIDDVFPSAHPLVLGGVSAAASGGVFALGYGIALLGADPYISEWYPYVGAGGIFWALLWLGWVDSAVVGVWNEVFPAFAVDSETYRDVIGARLAEFYDDRLTLGYSVVLVSLYVVVVLLLSRTTPFDGAIADLMVQPDVRAQMDGYSPARVANYGLFGLVLIPALVTSVRGFVTHVRMLQEVATLPFRNVHTAARQLEPLVRFSMTPATAWFVGISLVVLWLRAGLRGYLALLAVATLVLIGLLHIAVPLLILHDALQKARQELLREIRDDYDEIRCLIRDADESTDELSLWLEVTDRRQQNAKAISTWVYDLPSLSRFVAASVIPWLTLLERVLSLVSPP